MINHIQTTTFYKGGITMNRYITSYNQPEPQDEGTAAATLQGDQHCVWWCPTLGLQTTLTINKSILITLLWFGHSTEGRRYTDRLTGMKGNTVDVDMKRRWRYFDLIHQQILKISILNVAKGNWDRGDDLSYRCKLNIMKLRHSNNISDENLPRN